MKTLYQKYPILSQYVLAILLFALALIIPGLLHIPFLRHHFSMTSTILLIISSCVLLKLEKKSLHYLGLNLSLYNMFFLPLGIFIGAVAFLMAKYLIGWYTGEAYEITTVEINYNTILFGLYAVLPSVMVEELLFRGYVFKKTVEVSNVTKANIIFGMLFMLIHVIDRGVLQNKAMVLFFVVTIPIGHLLFSTAMLKSKTLFFPLGIHLGNNWATHHLISKLNNGNSFFYVSENVRFDTWTPFLTMMVIWNVFYLLVILIIWKWDKILAFVKP